MGGNERKRGSGIYERLSQHYRLEEKDGVMLMWERPALLGEGKRRYDRSYEHSTYLLSVSVDGSEGPPPSSRTCHQVSCLSFLSIRWSRRHVGDLIGIFEPTSPPTVQPDLPFS